MTQYDNSNRGSIWPNKKKDTEKHPDFTGEVNVDGRDYWVSAWKRKPDANPKAPSLTFTVKPKDGQAPPFREKPEQRRSLKEEMDGDEIPF
jgi:hypothetical protein